MKETDLAEHLENLFMALADKTRLRLLDLMGDGEVSVGHFTDALGVSQPKVSRHLAYLRSAGLVNTRRDGKSIYYCIRWPEEEGAFQIVRKTLEAMKTADNLHSGISAPRQLENKLPVIFTQADMFSDMPKAHNDLEEFLL